MNWKSKYRPNKIENLRHSTQYAETITKWLFDFYNGSTCKKKKQTKTSVKKNLQTTMIVRGNHGIGKTLLVDLLLDKLGIDKININFDVVQSEKHIKNKNFHDLLICSMDNNFENNSSKFAIVIDNMENLSIKGKIGTFIANLYKYVKTTNFCPLIFIVDKTHITFIKGLEKKELFLEMGKPHYQLMTKIIDDIMAIEVIPEIEDIIYFKDKLIESSQYDINRMLIMLENFITMNRIFSKKNKISTITNKMIDESPLFDSKDFSEGIYDTTKYVFNNFINPEHAIECYTKNRTTLPLMMLRNYMTFIHQYGDSSNEIELATKIAESFSYSDFLEDDIRTYQNWSMYDLHGYYSCMIPSYLLSSITNKSSVNFSPQYITDFTKVSTEHINKKNILTISKYYRKDIFEYMYMSKLLKQMILNNGIENLFTKMAVQGICVKTIRYLLKIDKISGKQKYNELTPQQEKIILSYIPKQKKKKKETLF